MELQGFWEGKMGIKIVVADEDEQQSAPVPGYGKTESPKRQCGNRGYLLPWLL